MRMKVLKELIAIIRPNLSDSLNGNIRALYEAIRQDKITTEEEGAALFFKDQQHQYKYFNKLKNDLKKILRNQLLVAPLIKSTSEAEKVFDECHKAIVEVKLLVKRNSYKEAINIAKLYLDQAKKYDLHLVAFLLAEELQYYSALHKGQIIEAKKYDIIAKEQLELSRLQNKLRAYYAVIGSKLNSSRNISEEFQIQLNEYYQESKEYLKFNSANLRVFVYSIAIFRHYSYFDYPQIVQTCQEANSFFLQSKYPERRHSFLYQIVPALIVLNRYKEARTNINSAIEIAIKTNGTVNWSICNYYSLVLSFYEGKYQKAYEFYHAVKKHSDKIYKSLGEDWLIIKAYLSFFIKIGKIETDSQDYFKLGQFLNELPIASKDKAGNYINVLIVQILHLIISKKGTLIDSIEAFEKFISRHLKDPTLLRAKIFLSMLLSVPKHNFHRVAVLRKTEKWQKKLQATPARMGQNLEIEIVPYEALWELVLDNLQDKFVGKLKRNRVGHS